MSTRSLIRSKIEDAKQQISIAEQGLTESLREIRSAPRADKTHVGETIERAFDDLELAKKNLAELQALLASEPDEA